MHQRALEQVGHGRQADVRVRAHVVVVVRAGGDRAEMVEEQEGADRLPRRGGQQTAHAETPAQVLLVRLQRQSLRHGAPSVGP